MIALLLALCAVPAPRWQDEELCWKYDDTLICRPRVVTLGSWDPRPLEWNTDAALTGPAPVINLKS